MNGTSWKVVAAALLVTSWAFARDLYVDPDGGRDEANALSKSFETGSSNGPVRTIARALELAGAGDTVHLAPASHSYHESVLLHCRAGEPGRPITIDGHGATLTGCDPLRPADWTATPTPGLFRSQVHYVALKGQDSVIQRVFFLFNGTMQRMDRTSKGAKDPFKVPESLKPGEWTFVEDTKTFYVRVEPGQTLIQAGVEAPYRANGVAISGRGNAHLVIKNLMVMHFLNDGFNIHNESRDVVFENIAAFENGDDGFSAHETCETLVNGYWASRNSTGVCNGFNSRSVMSNAWIGGNTAFDVYMFQAATFSLCNAVIESTEAQKPVVFMGDVKRDQTCQVSLDNVLVRYTGARRRLFEVGPRGVMKAKRLTTLGLSWLVKGQATVTESLVAGDSHSQLECTTDANWTAARNVYDVARWITDGVTNHAGAFASFRAAAGQDTNSVCHSFSAEDREALCRRPYTAGSVYGADPSLMTLPPPPACALPPSGKAVEL